MGPHRQVSFSVLVRYRRGTPTFAFFSLSLDPFFFRYSNRPASSFVFYHVVTPKLCSFSLFYNNSGHYPEDTLVCISF